MQFFLYGQRVNLFGLRTFAGRTSTGHQALYPDPPNILLAGRPARSNLHYHPYP